MFILIFALHVVMLHIYQLFISFLRIFPYWIHLVQVHLVIIVLKIKPTHVIKELCQLWRDLNKIVRLEAELYVHVKSLWHSCVWISFLSSKCWLLCQWEIWCGTCLSNCCFVLIFIINSLFFLLMKLVNTERTWYWFD